MARIFANADFDATQRNLTFNGTKFNLNGVQNKAVFSSLNTLSNENLKQFSKIVSKNLDLNDIKTSSKLSKNYEFANEVSFVDKISGNTINLKISNENLERLKTHFGSQNFDKDKNGQIIKYAKKTIENDPLGEPRVFVSLEEFLQKITQESQEMIKNA